MATDSSASPGAQSPDQPIMRQLQHCIAQEDAVLWHFCYTVYYEVQAPLLLEAPVCVPLLLHCKV